MRQVSRLARSEVALSWVNSVNGKALTQANSVNPAMMVLPRSGNPTEQAFYLWEIPSPPTGQQWALLVVARDGRCAKRSSRGTVVELDKCDPSRRDEQFWIQYEAGRGYRLRPGNALSECVDIAGPRVAPPFAALVPCSTAPSQRWAIWLNPYSGSLVATR